jgi:hypothetical protein
MDGPLKWLPDADDTAWKGLGDALRAGLPVPAGFVVCRATPEYEVRAAYEELKLREKTHFVAVRGSTHAVLNVIGPDALVHMLRRLWLETSDAPILVQRMIHSMWCGRTQQDGETLTIKVNEGMLLLDPDTYVVSGTSGQCIRQALEPRQRKMIRHVDGSARVVERTSPRTPMPAELLAKVAKLGPDVGWAIDDLEKIWLLARDRGN